ncbi:MAG TPA: type VI secretion system tube protein Hcp [Candidatus Limnocylindria bacterium]|nr:type VI secretion system tube protein Hcp [Candidatus Limnocylindria bacterium]
MGQRLAKSKRVVFSLVAVMLLASVFALSGIRRTSQAAPAAKAEGDYFLKLDGIEGESTDDKHKGEIEIHSFSWGVSQQGTGGQGGGGGTGKANAQDFHFTSNTSKASPKLFTTSASGKHIKEAILTVRKAGKGQQEYYKITMEDVLISSYQNGGSNGTAPTDQVSVNFAKLKVEYLQQKPDGSLGDPVIGAWDFKQNKEL